VNVGNLIPLLLLLLFSLAVTIGAAFVAFILRQQSWRAGKRSATTGEHASTAISQAIASDPFVNRPNSWLAIKTRRVCKVQSALGLHNVKPCSLAKGMSGAEKLFISPPINGWILVTGAGLPDPTDDVDVCFRFVLNLSRKVGEVQFFHSSRVLQDHAWVCANRGSVIRAYAWAGQTLWKQGLRTAAEKELELKCFDYGETSERNFFSDQDFIALNVEKVPLLAARWSLDPACIEERFLQTERGIAGEPTRRF
jgi:hypothetical protein